MPFRPSNCRRLANMMTSDAGIATSTVRITALIKRQPSNVAMDRYSGRRQIAGLTIAIRRLTICRLMFLRLE